MRHEIQFAASFLCMAVLVGSSTGARGDTVTLLPGADTSLFETTPDNNMGGNSSVAAGTTRNGLKSRALFKFDVAAQIPANATITSVKFTMHVTKAPGGAISSLFELHRVLKDWGEGNKNGNQGSAAAAGQATWNARLFPNDLWDAPGAASRTDYSATLSAVSATAVAGAGNYIFNSTAELVADVQAWMNNPQNNFGWILLSQREDTTLTARRIGAKESGASAPALTVEFTVSAALEPPTGLTATPGLKQVALTWTASANATSYNVLRATTSGGPYNAISMNLSTTSFTDTNVIAGTQYFYVVNAANATSQTANSSEVSAKPEAPVLQGPLLEMPQLVGIQFSFKFFAAAGGNYAVQFRESFAAGVWQTFTNIVAKFENKDVVITEPVSTSAQRYYRVEVTLVD